jgi:hypothetical protein
MPYKPKLVVTASKIPRNAIVAASRARIEMLIFSQSSEVKKFAADVRSLSISLLSADITKTKTSFHNLSGRTGNG